MKKFLPALLVLFFACAAHADIQWAAAGPYTGSVAAWGTSQQAGVKQAVDDINATGGLLGQQVSIKFLDDVCDPKQAVAVANRIISENIHFALHGSCSAASIPTVRVYSDENILVLNAFSSNPKLTDEGGPTIFRAMYRDDNNGDAMADEIAKHFKDKKLAIINDKSTYGYGIALLVKDRLNKAGMKEILFEPYDPTNHDYAVLASRLKARGVEAIFIGGYPVEIGIIARALRDAGSKAQILAGDLSTVDFWNVSGAAGEGAIFTFPRDPRKAPGAQKVIDQLRKKGIIVDGYTLYGYAAVQVLAQAITGANSTDPVKVAAYMHANEFKTILGAWTFDAKGDVRNISLVPYRWHDGNFEEIGEQQ